MRKKPDNNPNYVGGLRVQVKKNWSMHNPTPSGGGIKNTI